MSPFLLIPAFALLVAGLLTPVTIRLARGWGALQPARRAQDLHQGTMPRLGGVAIGIAFLAAALLSRTMPVPFLDPNEATTFRGLILGALVMLAAGIVDDRWELGPWSQLAAQLGVAAIAIRHDIIIEIFNNPLTNRVVETLPWFLMVPLTTLWIVGTINTVNFMDGLDGLAAGVTAIASAVFALHMIREGQLSVALLALALLGATLGVLPYNFHPARTFIGSSGSFLLGYAIAALSIMAGAKVATLLLVLGIPILDVGWQIVSRLRRGRSPMRADRGHLHHRLFDVARMSHRQVVLLYWSLAATFGVLALLLPSRLYKLYAILLASAVGMVLLWRLAAADEG